MARMNKIAVLGSGLLGGSIALAAQKRLPGVETCLWGRREASVGEAEEQGVVNATSQLEEAVKGADLIILASPVGAMLQILEAVAGVVSLQGVVVTDVGSVKLTPRDTLGRVTRESGAMYIGSHPMAGSEQAGVSAADAALFEGAACVLTNDFGHPEAKVSQLQDFWQALGCRCHLTSSEDHDQVMARISHFPHLLASVGALVGLSNPADGAFAGNGMRDTTRVASGHPGMWAEIMLRNRESLKAPVEEGIARLQTMLEMLECGDEEGIESFLQRAKDLRDQL